MSTPFTDKAREIARTTTYAEMSRRSNGALSHEWWRRLAAHGPWGGSMATGRVTPPAREAIPGIALLFGLPGARVAEMIAEDWFSARPEGGLTDRVLNARHAIDSLSDEDYGMVAGLARRLAELPG